MQHCDAEDLALLALNEPAPDPAVATHVHECAQCRAEVDELSKVVAIGRSIQVADQPVAPPQRVWEGITADLGTATGSTVGGDASVLDLAGERRRRRRWLPTAVAAAACLVLGGVVGSVVTRYTDPGPLRPPSVVATTTLDAVPGGPDPQTTGVAKIEQVDGQYVLQVDATGLRSPSGFYEVWLMNAQNSGLVAVGTFNADQTRATFPIPAGLPLTEFNSVDISDEPFDGVPGHSAVSVLRGTFTA